MRSIPVGVCIALLTVFSAYAQDSASVTRELLRLEQVASNSVVTKDRAAVQDLYADDYLYIHSNGTTDDKAQELSDLTSPDLKWTSVALTETNVRVYGNAAIATGVETLQGSAKGFVSGPRRITDIWVNRNGRWQEVGGQTTIVSKDQSNNAALSVVKTLTAKPAVTTTAEERAVAAADGALAKAEGANDDAAAKAVEARSYSFVSRTGVIPAPNAPAGTPNKSMVVAYDRVRVYGTLAVVQGSLLWTDVKGFTPGVLRFTRVWVKEGNTWKVAAEQRTASAARQPTT